MELPLAEEPFGGKAQTNAAAFRPQKYAPFWATWSGVIGQARRGQGKPVSNSYSGISMWHHALLYIIEGPLGGCAYTV